MFNRLWATSDHTAYVCVTKLMLKEVFGIEKLIRHSLALVAERRANYDRSFYLKLIQEARIVALIADVLFPPPWERSIRYFANPVLKAFLEGKFLMPETWHPVLSLLYFHEIRFRDFIDYVGLLSDTNITSLEEYEAVVFNLIKGGMGRGVITLKDLPAYRRVISYYLPTRDKAAGYT
ncbi:MAG: hypothetical protein ACUVR2_09650 [Anaerolineae bacterium]